MQRQYLIDNQDKLVEHTGTNHFVMTHKLYDCSLKVFLKRGGVRILCYGDSIAIESSKVLSDMQRCIILYPPIHKISKSPRRS